MASSTSRVTVVARAREAQCVELRKLGYSYRQIASQVGISEVGVMKALRRALTRISEQTGADAEDIKSLELERLDEIWATVFPVAKAGNMKAINAALKIMERRSLYLGLDAPRKLEADIHTDDVDEQIRAFIEQIKPRGQVSAPLAIAGPSQPTNT